MSFEAVIIPLYPDLQAAAFRLTRNWHDAEDLTQDVMVKASKGYEAFDGKHPKAWLFTMARTTWIDVVRGRNRRPTVLVEEDEYLESLGDLQSSAEDAALESPDFSLVWGILSDMRPEHRLVLLATAYDVRLSDLSRERGLNQATLGTQLLRARAKAKELLAA